MARYKLGMAARLRQFYLEWAKIAFKNNCAVTSGAALWRGAPNSQTLQKWRTEVRPAVSPVTRYGVVRVTRYFLAAIIE